MKSGSTKYFGYNTNTKKSISELERDFLDSIEHYDFQNKLIHHGPINDEKNNSKYLIELEKEGIILAEFAYRKNIKHGQREFQGLIKLLGFDYNSREFEKLNDSFFDLYKKHCSND